MTSITRSYCLVSRTTPSLLHPSSRVEPSMRSTLASTRCPTLHAHQLSDRAAGNSIAGLALSILESKKWRVVRERKYDLRVVIAAAHPSARPGLQQRLPLPLRAARSRRWCWCHRCCCNPPVPTVTAGAAQGRLGGPLELPSSQTQLTGPPTHASPAEHCTALHPPGWCPHRCSRTVGG